MLISTRYVFAVSDGISNGSCMKPNLDKNGTESNHEGSSKPNSAADGVLSHTRRRSVNVIRRAAPRDDVRRKGCQRVPASDCEQN